jgi:hypothetical protein
MVSHLVLGMFADGRAKFRVLPLNISSVLLSSACVWFTVGASLYHRLPGMADMVPVLFPDMGLFWQCSLGHPSSYSATARMQRHSSPLCYYTTIHQKARGESAALTGPLALKLTRVVQLSSTPRGEIIALS